MPLVINTSTLPRQVSIDAIFFIMRPADVERVIAENTPPQRFNDAPTGLLTANFTGRRTELDLLREVFSAAPRGIPIRCVICGMPGIGKTSLVLQYAVESFDQELYSQVLWSSGTTVDKLNEGMVKILDLVGHPERYRSEQSAKLTAARRWLEDPQGGDNIRWLLVIDNVDRKTLGFLREHLPRKNGQGHILFTTRTVDVADALVDVTGTSHSKLEIHVPDMCDTTRLFFSSAGIETGTVTSTQESEAEKLIEAVGSLPLAIVHAASYMKQTHLSLEDMLELYQGEHKGEMLQWENDLTPYQEQSVTATFEALFAKLDQDSARFLKLLSFLDPERIPLKMLIEGAKRLSQQDALPAAVSSKLAHIALEDSSVITNDPVTDPVNSSPHVRPLFTLILSPIQLMAAICKLQRLSLVEHLFDGDQSSLRIHDLIRYIIAERAKREATYQEWLCSAVSLVCRAFDSVEEHESPQWWPECEKFMPHLHSLNERWRDVQGVNLELAKAGVEIAKYLICRGRYSEAGAMCERSVESYEKECGTKHRNTLDAVHTLAQTYHWRGRYTSTKAADDRGADHKDPLDSMNNLASTHKQDLFNKARELLERVMVGCEKVLGPDHRHTFMAMDNLGEVYVNQERFDDAEQLLVRTLAGREKKFGQDDIGTLTTVRRLARVYWHQARCAEAEELYKRVLLASGQQLGPTHPLTLTTISGLAHLCKSQGRNDEAEEYFKRVLTGRMQALGPSHPSTLRTARRLADFYTSQGRGSEANAVLNSLRDG